MGMTRLRLQRSTTESVEKSSGCFSCIVGTRAMVWEAYCHVFEIDMAEVGVNAGVEYANVCP